MESGETNWCDHNHELELNDHYRQMALVSMYQLAYEGLSPRVSIATSMLSKWVELLSPCRSVVVLAQGCLSSAVGLAEN